MTTFSKGLSRFVFPAILFAVLAMDAAATTVYKVTGTIGGVEAADVNLSDAPTFGDFSFYFGIGPGSAEPYVYQTSSGGDDFTQQTFTIQGVDGRLNMQVLSSSSAFPIPDLHQDGEVTWTPPGMSGDPNHGVLELNLLGPSGWSIFMTLYFAPDFAGTGSADPQLFSAAWIIVDPSQIGARYDIESASVAPLVAAVSTPEPVSGSLVAFALAAGALVAYKRRRSPACGAAQA